MLRITPRVRNWAIANAAIPSNATDDAIRTAVTKALENGKLDIKELGELARADLVDAVAGRSVPITQTTTQKGTVVTKDNSNLMQKMDAAGRDGGSTIIVKAPSEMYDNRKSTGVHAKMGCTVKDEQGRDAMLPSELEYAKAGVFFKKLAKSAKLPAVLSEHEEALFQEMYEKDTWVGQVGPDFLTNISGMRVKQLISDTLSGGVDVNPAWFDDMLVQTPLLSGELLPMVDMKPVPRSASVQGASIGNPTFLWANADSVSASLFDTEAIISDVNTSIHDVSCAVLVGRNFLSDAAVDVGRYLVENIGRAAAAEWDKVIAVGDGVSQPTGLTNASGLGTATADNGGSGPPTVDDYEDLLFGIGKQYRTGSGNRCCFIGSDTSYQRSRAIPVGEADVRRVFGMDHESYMLLSRPYKIQGDIPNSTILFGDLSRYRLYRREGFSVEWHTQGKELALRNQALLVCRARMGGRVLDGNAFVKMTNAQS